MYSYLPVIGGAQVSTHSLANSLVKLGHDVTVYAADHRVDQCIERGWKFPYRTRGVPSFRIRAALRLGPAGVWFAAREMARFVNEDRLDVIQIIGAWPWIPMTRRLQSRTGVPVILRVAGEDIQVDESIGYGARRNKRVRKLLDGSFKDVDLAIAISHTVVDEYESVGIPGARIRVIPPGVDVKAFESMKVDRSAVRRGLGLPTDRRLIISVGRNHLKKGFADLVAALPSLNARSDAYAVAVVGDGSEELAIKARELGQEENFYPVPVLAEEPEPSGGTFPSSSLIELYLSADYFVLPSYLETYANVALEAMAAGLPVVVADAPGSRDTVEHMRDGLIVPVSDPDSIARAILKLDGDAALRRHLISGGHDKARAQDWGDVALKYAEEYRRLLSSPGQGGGII